MKILAVRGHDIASIADFDLDLTGEPLGHVGLFAITGPTGSGKSTLLDCLCLALFGTTPRLEQVADGRRKLQAGTDEISTQDPRNLLRRGSGHGWAEADFIGVRGQSLRGRFDVRRAHGKPGRKLQDWSLALTEVATGAVVAAGNKSETRGVIEAELGLSFDQFRRAALLAQGDFAAFLKAREDERAELLERMTGTELYAAISRAAFRRAADQATVVATLTATAGGQVPLEPSVRADLEIAHRAADAAVALATRAEAGVRAERQWFTTDQALAEQLTQATARASAAALALQALAPLQETLAAVDGVAALRQEVQASDTAARQELAAVALLAERIRTRWHQAVALVAAHDHALQAAQTAQRQCQQRGDAASAWLAAQAPLAPLVQGWARWQPDLAALADAQAALARLEPAREGLLLAVDGGEQAEARAAGRVLELGLAADQARQAATALAAQSDGDPTALAEQADALARQHARLVGARDLAAAVAALTERWDQARAQRETLAAEGTALAQEQAQASLDQAGRQGVLDAAEQALERLSREVAVAAHRDLLRPGEPCALCGAVEHPWAGRDDALARVVQDQTQAVATARQALAQGALGLQDVQRRHAQIVARSDAALAQRDQLQGELAAATSAWEDAAGSVSLPVAPTAGHTAAVQAIDALAAEQQALQARLADHRAHARRLAVARDSAERATAAHALGVQRHHLAQTALAKAQTELQAHTTALHDQSARREERRLGLDTVLVGDWFDEFLADPRRFAAGLADAVGQWQRHATTRERVATELARLDTERVALAVARERAVAAHDLAAADVPADAPAPSPCPLLDPPAAWEAFTRASALQADAGTALELARTAATAARVALGQALGERDEAQVRALLAHDHRWQQETREQVDRARAAHQSAQALSTRAADAVRDHQAVGRPADSPEGVAARLAEAQAAVRSASERKGSLVERLAADDRLRESLVALQAEIDAERVVLDHWRQLEGLIGQRDGGRFRQFAQSLTLEVLLGRANKHLEELSPRYQLIRAAGTDLGLQVIDRDMADELRSVASLSGGESFLASLALALGLASLSARDAAVETLFIDEGFGTLDPETLEIALHALDQLQASGRQVGLISHVPGLAERVGVRIDVRPLGGGLSQVTVHAPGA